MGNDKRLKLNGIVPKGQLDTLAKRIAKESKQFSGLNGDRWARGRGTDKFAREAKARMDRWCKPKLGL